MDRSDRFCCSGCRAVYQLLHSARLDGYYRIRDGVGVFHQASPVHPLSEKLAVAHPYAFLDDSNFRLELGIASTAPKIQFYLEGIYCTACLWLIEKLPKLLPADLLTARLDLQSSVVDFTFTEKGSISNVADYLDQLGYRPHPIFSQDQRENLAKKESRVFLSRMALAGALTGNIMIFAISIYAGATGFVKDHFDWIILLLALPVFFYSAVPLYQNAWNAMKNRKWSVDIPIVVALLAGLVVSTYSVLTGGDQNYLDSLTGLIFLLLGSRYFLMRLQKNAFEGMKFSESFYPIKILRNENEYVWVKDLKAGDLIEVAAGLRIPVDGVVVRGLSHINESILSGESIPKRVCEHDEVFAGSFNSDAPLWIKVSRVGDQTRIGKISKEIQKFEINRNETVKLAEAVAKWFTLSVLVWSGIVFAYYAVMKQAPIEGLQRVLSILIVSCPCAFALATPLALIQAFQVLMKRGVYLKDPNDLEKVSQLKQVAFDKTGTLTEGSFEVKSVQWTVQGSAQFENEYFAVIRSLENDSKHPVAKALLRYVDQKLSDAGFDDLMVKVENQEEIFGKGVFGTWKNRKVELKASSGHELHSQNECVQCVLWVDQKEVAVFSFVDRTRSDAKALVNLLQEKSMPVWMLSGDRDFPVQVTARELGIPFNHAISALSPEEKGAWLASHPNTLYVGDGANDGLALKNATLGIAAHGALDLSMKASGAYLTQNSLQGVADLFTVSTETRAILKRHLIFTILYNGSTITLASLGMLRPLIAAVLMPLSSLIILISTQIGTKKLRVLK